MQIYQADIVKNYGNCQTDEPTPDERLSDTQNPGLIVDEENFGDQKEYEGEETFDEDFGNKGGKGRYIQIFDDSKKIPRRDDNLLTEVPEKYIVAPKNDSMNQ